MWRPDDWDNPNWCNDFVDAKRMKIETVKAQPEYEAYEAGADAMYNALWKMAEESPTKMFTLDANTITAHEEL